MKASILIPAFNAADFIEDTLQSCFDQGEQCIEEIIVVDDHSTDATCAVVGAVSDRSPFIPIHLAQNPSKGACSARNHALSMAQGEAIQWLDADDILGPNKLRNQLELLKMNPNHLVASKWRRFEVDLTNLYPEEGGNWTDVPCMSDPLEWLKSERMMIPGGWLGRRKLFDKTGPWDESLSINQDGEYFTRAIAASQGVVFEPESRVFYRTGVSGSVSQFNPEKAPSLFRSCLSFEEVAMSLGNGHEVSTLISNRYQAFLYRVYPHVPDLRKAAREKIQTFGKPTLVNNVAQSTVAKLVSLLFGWKTLVQLRLIKSKILG